MTRPINLSPYYHAEIVHKNIKGQKLRGMVAWGDDGEAMQYWRKNRPESSVLLRPKTPLSKEESRRLRKTVKMLFDKDYGELKMPVMGLQRFVTPRVKGVENLSSICAGDVCSTGPASVYRALGRKPMKGVPVGTELASDYLRSKEFSPIAVQGVKYDMPATLKKLLAARLGFAAAAGLGTYQVAKDIKNKEYGGPAGALAGTLGGAALGAKFETNVETNPNYLRRKIRTLAKTHSNIPGVSKLKKLLLSIIRFKEKFPMWVPIATGLGAGALGYAAGKSLHRKSEQA
jgi:hypothetical protein